MNDLTNTVLHMVLWLTQFTVIALCFCLSIPIFLITQ